MAEVRRAPVKIRVIPESQLVWRMIRDQIQCTNQPRWPYLKDVPIQDQVGTESIPEGRENGSLPVLRWDWFVE